MTTTENTAPASTEVLEGEIVDADTTTAGEETSAPANGEVATIPEQQGKPAEVSSLTKAEARKMANKIKKDLNGAADLTERMNQSVDSVADLMAEAYESKIWIALDEPSWADFVQTELGDVRVRLERGVRQSLAYRMSEQSHMTTRAIAPVFGVDSKTVSNDLRQVRKELGVEAPTKVVGQDGKAYSASHTRTRKPKPIEDRFAAVIEKADAAVGDLTALSVEDGFAEAAGALAKTHRADIARLLDALKGVQDRLQ